MINISSNTYLGDSRVWCFRRWNRWIMWTRTFVRSLMSIRLRFRKGLRCSSRNRRNCLSNR